MKTIKKILYFFTSAFMYTVLFIMIIICITFTIYSIDTLKGIKSKSNPTPIFSSYVIASGSMIPKIEVNDLIVNERVEPYELKVGDIITFTSESLNSYGLTITHRIQAITQDASGNYYFRTKGDANNVADDYLVPQDHIIGKTIVIFPKIGYLRHALSSIYGIVILILLPIFSIVLNEFIILSKKIKENNNTNLLESTIIVPVGGQNGNIQV